MSKRFKVTGRLTMADRRQQKMDAENAGLKRQYDALHPPVDAHFLSLPREEQRAFIARQFFPFLMETARDASQLKLTYNRDKLVLCLEAFRYNLMAEVEAREDFPDELKMQFAEGVSAISKFFPELVSQIDSGGAEVILAMILSTQKSLDRIVAFLEIKSKGRLIEAQGVEV